MNQAEVTKLMSQLRVAIPTKARRMRNFQGPEGRLLKLRKTVTALLISDAIRYGDCHKATMDMADHWLLEKQLVHKLFKVLAPRIDQFQLSYTRMYKAPREYPGPHTEYKRAILELRGNPYPSVKPDFSQNRGFIHNVLLDEAKRQHRHEKYAEVAAKLTAGRKTDVETKESDVKESQSGETENIDSKEVDKKT